MVEVKGGRELAAKDANGLSDPFCEVRLLLKDGKKEKKKKTKVIYKTLNPDWDEKFEFDVTPKCEALSIVCFDKDKVGVDFMGKVIVSVADLEKLGDSSERKMVLEKRKDSDEVRFPSLFLSYGALSHSTGFIFDFNFNFLDFWTPSCCVDLHK